MQNRKRVALITIGYVALMIAIGAVAINVFGVSPGSVLTGLGIGVGILIVSLVRQRRSRTRKNAG